MFVVASATVGVEVVVALPTPPVPLMSSVPSSVNHSFPSPPTVIPFGMLAIWSRPVVVSVIVPLGVIRPIDFVLPRSVNHRLPSGPTVRSSMLLFTVSVN